MVNGYMCVSSERNKSNIVNNERQAVLGGKGDGDGGGWVGCMYAKEEEEEDGWMDAGLHD